MSKEKLIIRNFGPITKAEVAFQPLTVFIGDQGSGKSTISKVLTICRDLRWWLHILEGRETEIMQPFFDFSINEYFCNDTYFHYQNDSSDVVVYENGKFGFQMGSIKGGENAKRVLQAMIAKTTSSLMERTGKAKVEEIDTHTRNLLIANTRTVLYIPAERNLVGLLSQSLATVFRNHIPFPDVVLEYMSIFEKAKKELPVYEVPFLKVRYVNKDGRDRIVIHNSNKEVSFHGGSSGLQATIPMLMEIEYSRRQDCFDSFVVEEPEQNLFPQNQRELMYYFVSKLNNDKCSFILTTHSPYLLACLNNQMLAYRLYNTDGVKKDVKEIMAEEYTIDPKNVAVYSLGADDSNDEYCKTLISDKTGLVSINALDSVSEFIGGDFERLYSLYLRAKKKS